MASNISVSPEQLRGESTFVVGKADAARSDFEALNSRLQNLTSCFTGAAQEAFANRYNEWNGHAKGLVEALDALGQFLNTAAQTLEETDQQLAQGLSGS